MLALGSLYRFCICKSLIVFRNRSTPSAVENNASFKHNWNGSLREELCVNMCTGNRVFSTQQSTKNQPGSSLIASKDDIEFMNTFPNIISHLTDLTCFTDFPEISKWHERVLQYNLPHGKKHRGLAVVGSYKILNDSKNLSPENLYLANILGWCVEMFQAGYLIADDIMDCSEMRRGRPCWYKIPEIGLKAIHDVRFLEQGMYYILKQNFDKHPGYNHMLELFLVVAMKTLLGQALDSKSHMDGKPNFEMFTMKRYNTIVKYKTSYYTFQLPIALAMYLSNIFDGELHRHVKVISMEMGHLYQVRNDFLDCYGILDATGKDGTDIQEGKCSLLVILALQRANPAQKQILIDNYGKSELECVKAVTDIYGILNIPSAYPTHEEESLKLIRSHIQKLPIELPHKLFFELIEKIFK